MQLLLYSKVAKVEFYLISGYHNEWLELTFCIETLVLVASRKICKKEEKQNAGGEIQTNNLLMKQSLML